MPNDVSYAGLTVSALWAAIAECGASPMAIDPAVVAALLREITYRKDMFTLADSTITKLVALDGCTEQHLALWDAVEVLNEAARILDGRYWRIATDHGDTLAAALIALAGKVKEG